MSAGTVSRAAADSDAERVHELADAVHDLRLVRLQVPDEVPPEGVAVDGVLALEILRAVLPHDLDARLGENGHLLERDVLRRRDDRDAGADLGPDPLVGGAHVLRRHARSLPGRPVAARCGGARRRARGCSACRGRRARPPRRRPRGARGRRRVHRSRLLPRSTSGPNAPRTALRPRRPPRSSTARSRDRSPRASRPPSACDALGDDPGEQSPPADVEHGDARTVAADARERDREAVGRRARGSAGRAPRSRGRRPARRARPARPGARASSEPGG